LSLSASGAVLTNIGAFTFYGCTRLGFNFASLPDTLKTIGDSAFYGCGSMNPTIPGTVTSIGNSAFAQTDISGFTFNSSLTFLGTNAFSNCTNLAGLFNSSSTLTKIPDFTFYNCTKLGAAQVTLPSGLTTIGDSAFNGCGLLNLNLSSSITNIGNSAFSQSGLASVTWRNNLALGTNVFSGCTNLSSLTIISGLTAIPDFTFDGDTKLPSAAVIIPSTVKRIGFETFAGCTSLTSLTIPASVRNLGDGAFQGCTSMTNFIFLGNDPALGGPNVFGQINPATAVVYYLLGTVTWGTTYGGLQTMLLNPPLQIGGSNISMQMNGFNFTIIGTNTQVVVVEASTNLANPNWQPIQTNTLSGTSYGFNDPQWTNYPDRFYRVHSQ
jgi:hypothetical protein